MSDVRGRMRKLFALAVILASFFVSVAPARADHNLSGDFYPDAGNYDADVWPQGVNRNYCIEGFAGPLSSGSYTNMKNSTINRVNSTESTTDITTDWSLLAQVECSSDISEDFAYFYGSGANMAARCATIFGNYPNLTSRVSYVADMPDPADMGATMACDLDNNGKLDLFWIAINQNYTSSMHFDHTTGLGGKTWDYTGLFQHEFIHGTGFQGHFAGGNEACETITELAYSTMCNNSDKGIKQVGGSDGTWWRSLEWHDIGAVDEVY